ncbi:hypothetical protein D9M71_751700 [compost metagenome]
MVMPYSSGNLLIKLRISIMPEGSRPFVGSSKISNSGLCSKEAAIPRRCFIPKEKPLTFLWAASFKRTISKTSSIRVFGTPSIFLSASRFSYAVKCG